jgi:hypothetical protein
VRLRTLIVSVAILGGFAAFLLGAMIGWADGVASASSVSAQRHHSQALHAAQLRHAAHVRAARRRHSRARWEASEVHAHGTYWRSGFTTDTPQWRCIRLYEEGMATTGNVFGILGEWGEPFDVQAGKAIAIFRLNGWKWGPTAWSTHTVCGLP